MKKLLICLVLILLFNNDMSSCYAYAQSDQNAQTELENNITDQLGKLDFATLDQMLSNMTQEQGELFGKSTFLDKVKSLINGEVNTSIGGFFGYIISLLFDNIVAYIPALCTIVAISIVCSLIGSFSSDNNSLSSILYFVCFGVIVVIVFASIKGLVESTTGVITLLKSQMDIVFPVLLTLVTSLGSVVTVSAFQPAVALLCSGIVHIFTTVLVPIFLFSMVFVAVGNLSPNVKLDKCTKFCSSIFKWIIGVVFSVFLAILSVQGITAASVDGISIKTAKFALKSYVPILGGYLSDGLNLIMASSVLIKNAVGATGLILMFATVVVPVVKIGIYSLGLKLVAAIVEPLSNNKIANFLYGVAKCLTMLIACILAVGFMYLTVVGLLMCMANVV